MGGTLRQGSWMIHHFQWVDFLGLPFYITLAFLVSSKVCVLACGASGESGSHILQALLDSFLGQVPPSDLRVLSVPVCTMGGGWVHAHTQKATVTAVITRHVHEFSPMTWKCA